MREAPREVRDPSLLEATAGMENAISGRVAAQSAEHLQELRHRLEEADARVEALEGRLEEPNARIKELVCRLEELDARMKGMPALIEKAVTPVQESLKGLCEARISEALVPIRKELVPLSQIERMVEGVSERAAGTQESIKEIREMLDTRILATEQKIQEAMEPLRKTLQDKLGADQVRAAIAPVEQLLQEKVSVAQANELVTQVTAPLRSDLQSLSSQPTVEQAVAKALEVRVAEVVEAAEQLVQAEVALVQEQIASQREQLQSLLDKSQVEPVEAEAPAGNSILLLIDLALQVVVAGVVLFTAVGVLYEPVLRPNVPQREALSK